MLGAITGPCPDGFGCGRIDRGVVLTSDPFEDGVAECFGPFGLVDTDALERPILELDHGRIRGVDHGRRPQILRIRTIRLRGHRRGIEIDAKHDRSVVCRRFNMLKA